MYEKVPITIIPLKSVISVLVFSHKQADFCFIELVTFLR